MRMMLYCLAGIALGYVLGVGLGIALIDAFSSNTHDKNVEVAMTAAFVTGPAGAVLGLIVAWMRARRR